MTVTSIWSPSITSTYSGWSVQPDEWLLASRLPGLLHSSVTEGHTFLARLWDEVEVMSDEQYTTYVNKLKKIFVWCLVSPVSFFWRFFLVVFVTILPFLCGSGIGCLRIFYLERWFSGMSISLIKWQQVQSGCWWEDEAFNQLAGNR